MFLKYTLLKETEYEVIYKYYPEGGTSAGEIAIDKRTGECKVNILAEGDENRSYALKMFNKMKRYLADGAFESDGMIACG